MNTENFKSLSHATPLELVGTLPDNSLALEQRIFFAQQTIRNTLVKLGHLRRPDHLLWALHTGGGYHAIGFARETGSKGYGSQTTYRDITAEVRSGQTVLGEHDYLRFAITYPNSGAIGQGYIQLQYLRNDPISIAQMVRRTLTNYENGQRELDRAMHARELKRLEAEQATAQRKYEREAAALQQRYTTAQKLVTKKPLTKKVRQPVTV